MAKLYATLASEKAERVASKGGNYEIVATLSRGNKITHTIEYGDDYIIIKKIEKGLVKNVYSEIPF